MLRGGVRWDTSGPVLCGGRLGVSSTITSLRGAGLLCGEARRQYARGVQDIFRLDFTQPTTNSCRNVETHETELRGSGAIRDN